MRSTSAYYSNYKDSAAEGNRTTTGSDLQDADGGNPELARYLNRSYWEGKQGTVDVNPTTASPSAPTSSIASSTEKTTRENGYAPSVSLLGPSNEIVDAELEEFVRTLKSQVEIFINRMKSNSSRGRSIANDSSVETLFLNITSMHSKLLGYIQKYDDSRLYYERQQDKLTQMKDARAALDALREEHRDKLRRQAEEAERQRQMMMAHKLDIMRKKKQQYLQYQRQLALQRIQEQEREMQMRQEQQKQQYIMGPAYYSMGSPVHAPQYPPQSYGGYPSMVQGPPPSMPQHPPNAMMPPGAPVYPQQSMGQPQPQAAPQQPQPQTNQMPMGVPPNMAGPPGMQAPPPMHHPPMQQQQPYSQQPGAPPASPQAQAVKQEDAQTAELIFFD
ncbi:PREDICTED: hepatocyte growth factor-regulated tyrosine kinase substrate [Nicrophorus vespilloides]|uniref:Hepatocyte growth factor-regulated tyrosine kinase substrate n=1 Tax=Nicrophorus vespilloides TaxID=110193 RepID=A0ABM1MGN5_NICVS|nr:PREDICTED: hepatocyte growth factor-regulated tyrosine kinase substrate [Nicrophorus vespilloides]